MDKKRESEMKSDEFIEDFNEKLSKVTDLNERKRILYKLQTQITSSIDQTDQEFYDSILMTKYLEFKQHVSELFFRVVIDPKKYILETFSFVRLKVDSEFVATNIFLDKLLRHKIAASNRYMRIALEHEFSDYFDHVRSVRRQMDDIIFVEETKCIENVPNVKLKSIQDGDIYSTMDDFFSQLFLNKSVIFINTPKHFTLDISIDINEVLLDDKQQLFFGTMSKLDGRIYKINPLVGTLIVLDGCFTSDLAIDERSSYDHSPYCDKLNLTHWILQEMCTKRIFDYISLNDSHYNHVMYVDKTHDFSFHSNMNRSRLSFLQKDIFSNFTYLQNVRLRLEKFVCVDLKLFQSLVHLKSIEINGGTILNNYVDARSFAHMHQLEYLILQVGSIKLLADIFSNQVKLKELRIHCDSEMLISQNAFIGLVNLTSLTIDCTLDYQILSHMKCLEYICINKRQFKSLDAYKEHFYKIK